MVLLLAIILCGSRILKLVLSNLIRCPSINWITKFPKLAFILSFFFISKEKLIVLWSFSYNLTPPNNEKSHNIKYYELIL